MSTQTQVSPSTIVVAAESSEFVKALGLTSATMVMGSGSYSQPLDLTMFTVIIFYILTISGLFVLWFRRPGAERPYRAFGYPILSAGVYSDGFVH